jgi:NAD(P)-dependent dehydrogenase (short-subunit alcohol dehydrogenase family)
MSDQKGLSKTPAPVALVIGAGDATGGAVARRFAREGYQAVITRRARNLADLEALAESIRQDGGTAHAFGIDAREEDEMVPFFEQVERDIGPIDVTVFNVGGNVQFSITETTSRVYRKVWEMAAFAGFLTGRETARYMLPRGRGTIIFTGATASVRGGSGFAAFAGGKHALRALAQSMARELGPKGIHVAHVIIDGAIDTKWIEERFPERYALKAQDGVLQPDDIAEAYWTLHCQNRSAWTHEMDLRPWIEPW